MMIEHAIIRARRDALQQQLDRGRLIYGELELARDRALEQLADLQRELDAMYGGLQELDRLLAQRSDSDSDQAKQIADIQQEQQQNNGTLAHGSLS